MMRVSRPFMAYAQRHQIAVIGSGPGGCYVADHLLKKHDNVHVDVYDRLPVPFGLSRYGVAPDHPEVKNVEKKFTEMFQSGRCTFIGNVHIGKDIKMWEMMDAYTAVVLATGADDDRKLGIPGESLANVISARRLVNWYNTMPEPYSSPKMCPLPITEVLASKTGMMGRRTEGGHTRKLEHVMIIGNGNVAIDCARALAAPYKHFCPTDMNAFAIRDLMNSTVKDVSVVGRRGVEHSAFTTKEFREISTALGDTVKVAVEPFSLEKALEETKSVRAKKRQLELVHKHCYPHDSADVSSHRGRRVFFRYNLTPEEFLAHGSDKETVAAVVFKVNKSKTAISPWDRKPKSDAVDNADAKTPAAGSNESAGDSDQSAEMPERVVIPCDAVITSIGYRSVPIQGVPFDDASGTVPNTHGRVVGMPRVYCSGWLKTGPRGVIVSTMQSAFQTADAVLHDIAKVEAGETLGAPAEEWARSYSTFFGWQRSYSGVYNAEKKRREKEATEATKESAETAASDISGDASSAEKVEQVEPEVEVESTADDKTKKRDYPPEFEVLNEQGEREQHIFGGKYALVSRMADTKMRPVSMAGVKRIWHVEKEQGVMLGKHAEKIPQIEDMITMGMGGRAGRRAAERHLQREPARPRSLQMIEDWMDPETELVDLSKLDDSTIDMRDMPRL